MSYDVGDDVTVFAVFRDADGDQAAPDEVVLHVLDPATGESEVVTNEAAGAGDVAAAAAELDETLADETGLFKATIEPDSAGVWWYAWIGTGTVPADRQERWFDVRRQRVPAVSS